MTTTPIKLKLRDVALAARRAYDAGRLSAQGPTPDCAYLDDSGRPCAVSAGLSARTVRRLQAANTDDVYQLLDVDLLNVDDPAGLTKLQEAHDSWALAVIDRAPKAVATARRAAFVRAVNRAARAA